MPYHVLHAVWVYVFGFFFVHVDINFISFVLLYLFLHYALKSVNFLPLSINDLFLSLQLSCVFIDLEWKGIQISMPIYDFMVKMDLCLVLDFLDWLFCLFVCWFVWSFSSRGRATNFDLYMNSALVVVKQWGIFNSHTFSDTGQPFNKVIFENPCYSHLLPSVW